jgi:hypothetical protein
MVTIHFIKLSFAVINRNQLFFSGAFRVRMSPFFCAEAIFASGVGDIGTYILMKLCIDGFQGCKLNHQQITVQFCMGRLIVYSASQTDNTSFSLPYRLVFAVATLDSLFIYDTQHSSPIVVVAGLHYAAITDIAWSADAQYVAVSSQDGYCSLFSFTDAELGVQMPCSGTFLINFPHSPVGFCHSQLCVV